MASLSWQSPNAENIWNVCKSNARWWQIPQRGWFSHLSFQAKVFIRRVMIDGFPSSSTLRRREVELGKRFFCTIPLEDYTHKIIICPIPHIIWKYLFGRCYPFVIWCFNNGFLLNMFKFVQMMSWRSCSKFYDIWGYNTFGVCIIVSCSMVGME